MCPNAENYVTPTPKKTPHVIRPARLLAARNFKKEHIARNEFHRGRPIASVFIHVLIQLDRNLPYPKNV